MHTQTKLSILSKSLTISPGGIRGVQYTHTHKQFTGKIFRKVFGKFLEKFLAKFLEKFLEKFLKIFFLQIAKGGVSFDKRLIQFAAFP